MKTVITLAATLILASCGSAPKAQDDNASLDSFVNPFVGSFESPCDRSQKVIVTNTESESTVSVQSYSDSACQVTSTVRSATRGYQVVSQERLGKIYDVDVDGHQVAWRATSNGMEIDTLFFSSERKDSRDYNLMILGLVKTK